jgi:hypothetical protein
MALVRSSRLAGLLVLVVAGGCHRAKASPAPPKALPIFVDKAAPGELIPAPAGGEDAPEVPSDPAKTPAKPIPIYYGIDEGKGTLEAPTAPMVEVPVQKDGPPADGIVAVLGSLTAAARDTVPDPATLPFYDLDLRVEPAAGHISGQLRIDYPNHTGAPLGWLPLRVFADADDALVNIDSVRLGEAKLSVTNQDPSTFIVKLPAAVPVGTWVHLTVAFHGAAPPPAESTGTEGMLQSLLAAPGRSPDYGLFSTFKDGVALGEFLPMVAGRWNGKFDLDPGNGIGDSSYYDLSSFRARVDIPAEYVVAGPGVETSEERGGRRRSTFALADARDFPLFASTRYRETEAIEGGIRVRSIYQESAAEAGRSVLATARGALSLFGELYHPYPYTTFTAVEVPMRGGAGGAEFPGLVAVAGMAYGEEGGLPGGMSFSPGYLVELREFVVAHEVAHQWWACAVASHPRAQPDVDEPLAQYSAGVYVGHARGQAAQLKALNTQVAVNYQAARMLGLADGVAARATGAFQNSAEYAGLVYGKAPFFYQTLSDRVGEPAVSRGLAEYAQEHWMGLAKRGDVVTALAKAGALPESELNALFVRWFRGAHGDEDLAGKGDIEGVAMDAFAGGAGGMGAMGGAGLDPSAVMKLLPAQGAPVAPDNAGAAGFPGSGAANIPGVDPEQVKNLMQQLDKSMGGIDGDAK